MSKQANNKTARSLLTRLTAGLMVAALLLTVFLLLFSAFERIGLQAIVNTQTDFVRHTSSISDAMQSLVQSLGAQIYYISSTTRLRTASQMSTFDRIYALRELGQYVSASQMLQSIYVFNEAQGHVYSTDESFYSAGFDRFVDQQALTLYQSRSPDSRGRLIYRSIDVPSVLYRPRESYAFLVFETSADGSPLPGAVVLNLDPNYFRNRLLSFSGHSTLVMDHDGRAVAYQDEALIAPARALLPQVLSQSLSAPGGYIRGSAEDGQQLLCFYALMGTGDWITLRIIPYHQALPGLHAIRDAAALVIGGVMLLLLLATLLVFLRVYRPFSRMRRRLAEDSALLSQHQHARAAEKLDHILAASLQLKREEALREALLGKPCDMALLPQRPWWLLRLDIPLPQLQAAAAALDIGDHISLSEGGHSLLLGALAPQTKALDLAQRLSQSLNCRSYYSHPLKDLPTLAQSARELYELSCLRLYYPGQHILSQALIKQHRSEPGTISEDSAEMQAALRAGDVQPLRQAFVDYMGRLRHLSFADLSFALKRGLNQLQPSGLTEPAFGNLPTEELLLKAEDTGALFDMLCPQVQLICQYHQDRRQQRADALSEQVIKRLEMGYSDAELGAKQIAGEMGITPAYLRKQFFEANGVSVAEYLNRLRIDQAKHLLQTSELSVEAIARQIGFENHKYMFVLFKRIVGMTPRQFTQQTTQDSGQA